MEGFLAPTVSVSTHPSPHQAMPHSRPAGPTFRICADHFPDLRTRLSGFTQTTIQADRDEVDMILESQAGGVVGIEVKATASLSASDWAPLVKLRDRLGPRFTSGVVFYAGSQTLPLTERLWALPINALWQAGHSAPLAMDRGSGS